MATKVKKEMKVEKKASKAPAKAAPTKSASKSSGKLEAKFNDDHVTAVTEPGVDADEAEEQADEAASSASGGGGNAAALAAASGATEMSASFKNFRHHPDMENFYRFIFDNDLRHEALTIIDEIMTEKEKRKMMKGAKANAH